MSTVAEVAMVVRDDYIKKHKYQMHDLILEYAFMQFGNMYDSVLWEMDSGEVLSGLRDMCAEDDWQRVMGLVILWHLTEQQKKGLFS